MIQLQKAERPFQRVNFGNIYSLSTIGNETHTKICVKEYNDYHMNYYILQITVFFISPLNYI